MADKPEALRLAEWVETNPAIRQEPASAVAAELRRLHAENERLHQINQSHKMKLSVRGYEIQIADLKAVNQDLLRALKAARRFVVSSHESVCTELDDIDAAIAKAEGQK